MCVLFWEMFFNTQKSDAKIRAASDIVLMNWDYVGLQKVIFGFFSRLELHTTMAFCKKWVSSRQIIAHKSSSSFLSSRWSHTSTFTRLDWGQIEFDNLFFPLFSFAVCDEDKKKVAEKKTFAFWSKKNVFLIHKRRRFFILRWILIEIQLRTWSFLCVL